MQRQRQRQMQMQMQRQRLYKYVYSLFHKSIFSFIINFSNSQVRTEKMFWQSIKIFLFITDEPWESC